MKQFTYKFIKLLACFIIALPIAIYSNDEDVLAAWIQYTVEGVEARAVVERHSSCPSLKINGQDVDMTERASPTRKHPNIVCSTILPSGVNSVKLYGEDLPVPKNGQPKRIVVVGDTGCRLSDDHGLYQACNNSSIWPFSEVAKSIAKTKPDLIIHMGDNIYREARCPAGNTGCSGSPHGDREETWKVEVIDPTQPIQLTAPLILMRGNHENCERAGFGWFRYFDANGFTGECVDTTDPWVANLNNMQIGTDKLISTHLRNLDKKVFYNAAAHFQDANALSLNIR